jgi:hypothetical protein
MEQKNQPENQSEHTPATKAIFKNAVECGKFTQGEMDDLAKITPADAEMLKVLKGLIQNRPINPELIKGKYHPNLIDQAANNSFDNIHKCFDCDLRNMKENAPELYKAKFFEKYGRLPAALPKQ